MGKIKKLFNQIKENGLVPTLKRVWLILKSFWLFKVTLPMEKKVEQAICSVTKNKDLLNLIVIESHNDFDCNGGAFYNYLIENHYNKRYKIVWLIKNKLNHKLPENVVAYNIAKFSLKKCFYIARARFLLSDDFITEKVRDDQKTFYCTHGGVTFKNVKGLITVPDSVDYILSASKRYDPYICENYSIPHPNNRMLHLGFPSNDIIFSKCEKVEHFMGCEYKKKILWMPTFRKSSGLSNRTDTEKELALGIPLLETKEELERLNEFLRQKESLLIIKLHPMQDLTSTEGLYGYSNILVLSGKRVKELGIDTYELMAESDALLSDYSSAAYSFMLKNKPIGFVLADLDDYKLGFSVEDYDRFLPGNIIYTADEFCMFIENVINEKDDMKDEREQFLEWLYEFRDNKSCVRLAEFMQL